MELDELYLWLQDRALQEMRAWYGNLDGIYGGSMQARLGSTTWRFDTGGGWSEPQLVWYAAGRARTPYRMTWYGGIYVHEGDDPVDAGRFIKAIERLSSRLQSLDWSDPRPPRELL